MQSLAMLGCPAAPSSGGPFDLGTVTAIAPLSSDSPLLLATANWADGYTSQVNGANLKRQPGNSALEVR